MPLEKPNWVPPISRIYQLTKTLAVLWALVLLVTVAKCAVDLPVQDEWELFAPDALVRGTWGPWIFRFHNEHRIVFSNFVGAASYSLVGLNFAALNILSFCLYLFLLFWLWRALRFELASRAAWVCFSPLLFSPLLSTLPLENFTRYDQIGLHASILGFAAGTFLLLSAPILKWRQLWGVFALFLVSMYSFSAGLIAVWVSFLASALIIGFRGFCGGRAGSADSMRKYAALGALLSISTALWASGSPSGRELPLCCYPWSLKFWAHYVQLIALGFGFDQVSVISGVLCFGSVVAVVIFAGWKIIRERKSPIEPCFGASWVLLLGLLAVLATISFGRAGPNGVEQAKSSRYMEFTGFVPVLIGALLYRLEEIRVGPLRLVPAWLAIALLAVVSLNAGSRFNLRGFYGVRDDRIAQQACVLQIMKHERAYSDSACSGLYGIGTPPAELLAGAASLKVRFAR
jgi:hypothetical protein